MKKLRLKALSLGAKEILNREQLKSIYGGDGSGSDGGGGGYDQGGCDTGGPVTWNCSCYSYENAGYIYYDCCTNNYADWQCSAAAAYFCPGNAGSAGCNPAN